MDYEGWQTIDASNYANNIARFDINLTLAADMYLPRSLQMPMHAQLESLELCYGDERILTIPGAFLDIVSSYIEVGNGKKILDLKPTLFCQSWFPAETTRRQSIRAVFHSTQPPIDQTSLELGISIVSLGQETRDHYQTRASHIRIKSVVTNTRTSNRIHGMIFRMSQIPNQGITIRINSVPRFVSTAELVTRSQVIKNIPGCFAVFVSIAAVISTYDCWVMNQNNTTQTNHFHSFVWTVDDQAPGTDAHMFMLELRLIYGEDGHMCTLHNPTFDAWRSLSSRPASTPTIPASTPTMPALPPPVTISANPPISASDNQLFFSALTKAGLTTVLALERLQKQPLFIPLPPDTEICPVFLRRIVPNDPYSTCTSCLKHFCITAIFTWLSQSRQCPMCRGTWVADDIKIYCNALA